jgi:chemotaxis protein CheY-P-specific phosphatase CheC
MAEEIFNADEADVLGEMVNIAMGKAGATLAEAFSGFVHMRVPEIHAVNSSAMNETRERLIKTYDRISIIHQEFFGEFSGDIAVIYGPASYTALREVLGFDDRDGDGRRQREELLLELGNAMSSTCITEVAAQLGLRTGVRPPRMAVFDLESIEAAQKLFDDSTAWKGQTLQISIIFHLEAHQLPFELLFTVNSDCMPMIKESLIKHL